MLNLYAVLNVSSSASHEHLHQAIEHAAALQQLPMAVVQSARFYLLDAARRQAYDHALNQALHQGKLTTDWETELAKQQESLPMLRSQAVALNAINPPMQNAQNVPELPSKRPVNNEKHTMKMWHWALLVVCVVITGVLVAALWQMAQVQMHQNQKLSQYQTLQSERRLPEDWPTWRQEQGQTYLLAAQNPQVKLSIHKNAEQDLPILSVPANVNLDCGERGNQTCAVTFVFDGQDPHTYQADIVGKHLVFKDTQQLPYLMHELSRATSITTKFASAAQMPEWSFGRDVIAPVKPQKK